MQIIKYLILSIISSITNTLPISYSSHITLYQNLFNTNTFDNSSLTSLLNISLIIAIIIYLTKYILIYFKKAYHLKRTIKEEKRKNNKTSSPILNKQKNLYKNHIKYFKIFFFTSILSSIIYLFIPRNQNNLKLIAISYLLTSLILFGSTNKKGQKEYKDLSYKTAFILSISTILCIIPTLSPLCIYLFILAKLKYNKEVSFNFSLINIIPILLINSTPGLIDFISNQTYLFNNIISIFISSFISFHLLNYLKKIYLENKLYKLSIYCLFLSIFILIWFR